MCSIIFMIGEEAFTLAQFETGQDFAGWLNELSDTLHIDNNIRIVGYLTVVGLCSQYALYYPERLNHVVLITSLNYFASFQ